MTVVSDIPKSIRREIKRAKKHVRKLSRAIEKAEACGNKRLAERLQREFVGSYYCRLFAVYEAWKRIPILYRPPHAVIVEIAERINPWYGTDELVEVFLKLKRSTDGNEDFRPICRFGPENSALQILVGAATKPRVALLPNQYATLGLHAAVEAAKEAILAGFRHVAEYDIRNFYPGITGDMLRGILPLPSRLIESVILMKNLNLVPRWFNKSTPLKQLRREIEKLERELATPAGNDPDNHHHDDHHHDHQYKTRRVWDPLSEDYFAEARTGIPEGGIPQGSSTSNLVAEIWLKSVIEQISVDCGVVINYADNFLLLSSSGEGLAMMKQTLWSAVEARSSGLFRVAEKGIYRPGEAIDFLGYTITPTSGEVVIEPQKKNLRTFRREFARRRRQVERKTSPKKRRKLIKSARGYVRSWSGSFSLWDRAVAHREQHLAILHGQVNPKAHRDELARPNAAPADSQVQTSFQCKERSNESK